MPGPITAKATWFFKDIASGSAGWSESFYMTASDIAAAMANANNDAYNESRVALMPATYRLAYIRVVNVQLRGASLVTAKGEDRWIGKFPITGADPLDNSEEVYDSLLIRLQSGTIRRLFTMRGLPTEVVTKNENYNPSGGWLTAFERWQNNVFRLAFQLRSMVPSVPMFPATVTILPDEHSLQFGFGTQPFPALTFAYGDVVSLKKVGGVLKINKRYRLKGIDAVAKTMTTLPGLTPLYGVVDASSAQLFQLVPSYGVIDSVDPLRGTTRKTGRPFDVRRGRTRVQRV